MFIIIKFLYVSLNWAGEQCHDSNFFLAPLFGENSQATFNKCANDAMQNALNDKDAIINKNIVSLTKSIKDLSNNKVYIASNSGGGNTPASDNYTQLAGSIGTIQNNLSKILGSIVLSSYMNNGVLQSTNSLQNSQLTNLIKEYNAVGQNITNQEQAINAMQSMTYK